MEDSSFPVEEEVIMGKPKGGGGQRKGGVTTSSAPKMSAVKQRRIAAQKAREERNRELRAEGSPTPSDLWSGARERAQAAREHRAEERRNSPWRQIIGHVKGEGPRVQRVSRETSEGLVVSEIKVAKSS